MNKRLALLVALFALAYAGWYWLGPTSTPPGSLRTDGSLSLEFQSVVRDTNQVTPQQLQGRALLLAQCPAVNDTGLARDRFFKVTNTGHKPIRIYAYNPSLPFYRIETKTTDAWTAIPTAWNSRGGVIMLRSGQTLSFPAITPKASIYRIGVAYEEVEVPVTVADNLMHWTLSFLFPKKRWDGTWFLAYCDEIKM